MQDPDMPTVWEVDSNNDLDHRDVAGHMQGARCKMPVPSQDSAMTRHCRNRRESGQLAYSQCRHDTGIDLQEGKPSSQRLTQRLLLYWRAVSPKSQVFEHGAHPQCVLQSAHAAASRRWRPWTQLSDWRACFPIEMPGSVRPPGRPHAVSSASQTLPERFRLPASVGCPLVPLFTYEQS